MTTSQDSYVWIYAIVASCESKFHFEAADVLIDLFGKKYPEMKNMRTMLIDLRSDVYFEKFKTKLYD